MTIARTDATGGTSEALLPEVLAFTSSLPLDRHLLREDLVGSLAHLVMLARRGIIPREHAEAIRAELLAIVREGAHATLPDEEDVHMAVEARLAAALGERAGLLHTARSRNDQVALDLRLHAREACALALEELAALVGELAARAREARAVLFPSYTHRQRAQPVTLGYVLCAWGAAFARDVDAVTFALEQADVLPLGVGAIAGTSLPTDRTIVRDLLGFAKISANGMDTVGDRDFALDLAYATTRSLLHAGRVATDLVDFSTQEFGYAKLGGAIACGSSMMPQKRNPDLFELVRAKSARAVGNLTSLLVLTKGLPGGYNRDLQEDRQPLLETGPLFRSTLAMLRLGLANVRFDEARARAALEGDYTQATDIAEELALRGVTFRTAYQIVGRLVRACQDQGIPLAKATAEMASAIDPRLDASVLEATKLERAHTRRTSEGGAGEASVLVQCDALEQAAARARERAAKVPRLAQLAERIEKAELR